jgi:hypothetical protein
MAKYNQLKFNEKQYGTAKGHKSIGKRCYAGIFIGFAVRGSIADRVTYRVRRGNGYAGTIYGKRYFDKYKYFIPASINNAAGQTSREVFADAMHKWTYEMTAEQKKVWNDRAIGRKAIFGKNLYIAARVKAEA